MTLQYPELIKNGEKTVRKIENHFFIYFSSYKNQQSLTDDKGFTTSQYHNNLSTNTSELCYYIMGTTVP